MHRIASFRFALLVLWCAALAGARAQVVYYWDLNGEIAGAGGATPTGVWDGITANWTTDVTGMFATTTFMPFSIAGFAAGADATGDYTVTIDSSRTIAGLRFERGNVTIAGGQLAFYDTAILHAEAGASGTITSELPLSGGAGAPGALQKTGAGTVVLASRYGNGGADITAGTLVLRSNGTVNPGSVSGDITNEGSLVFDYSHSQTVTFDGAISGAGSVKKTGAASTLILTGNNSHTGGTTITGGTLQIGNGGTTGMIAGDVVNDGILSINRSDDVTLAGNISGTGALTKSGAGTLTLGGANSYSGTTTVSAGRLRADAADALAKSTDYIVNGVLDLNNHALEVRVLSGNGTIELGSAELKVNDSGSSSFNGNITGTGSFTKAGSGTFSLTGASSFTGGTTISGGTLRLGSSGANHGSLAGNIVNNANLTVGHTAAQTVANDIGGTGTLTLASNALTTLTGNNTFTGGVIYGSGFSGSLQIGNGGTSGTLASNVTLTSLSRTLTFNRSDDSVYAGIIGSTTASQVIKQGAGKLVLTGANTFTGTMNIQGGTLQLGNGGTTGSLASAVTVGSGATLAFNRSDSITFAQAVSGSGGLTQAGAGTLILTGASTYTGPTTINSGATLQVGAGGATGAIAGDVANAGTFIFNRTGSVTYAGTISGAGAVTKLGTGTLTLTGDHTYTGLTSVTGTLNVGSGGASGTLAGNAALASGATLRFNRSNDVTYGGVISGAGSTTTGLSKSGAGTLALTGTNTFTGGTTISGGFIEFGALNAFGSGATRNLTLNGGGLKWATGSSTDVSARLAAMGANGGTFDTNGNDVVFASSVTNSTGRAVEKIGAGKLTLASSFGNSGGTFTLTDGVLQLGNGGTTGSISGSFVNNATVLFNHGAGNVTNAVTMTGSGSVEKLGTGTLTLTGNFSHGGGTTVSAGTLRVGSGNNGTLAGDIVNNSVVSFGRSDTSTYAGNISGSGSMLKGNSSTSIFTGDLTYTGGTTLTSGTIQIGNGGSTGSLAGNVMFDGSSIELRFNRGDSHTFAGSLSGHGILTHAGSGTLSLTGAGTFTGQTRIEAGTLHAAVVAGSVFGTSQVTVFSGATLTGPGDIGGGLLVDGTYSPGNSPALVSIGGDLTLGSGSLLLMELGGLDRGADYDALDITGSLFLDGTLQVDLINGFTPTAGATFHLFDAGNYSGNFTQLLLPVLDAGLAWDASALPTAGQLSVMAAAIPEPSTYAALFGALAIGMAVYRRWRVNKVVPL